VGLFSALTGSGGKSTSNSNSVSGYGALPTFAQNTLQGIDAELGHINYSNFYPTATSADEQQAFSNIRQGFTPTQTSLNADIAMQQNPYNSYVIDEINRQSQGGNSILQQNLNSAGQFGSNRQMLGANDIDLSRQNQIGGFLQSQFNTSLNNALTTLPALRAADTQGLLDIGAFDRNLALQRSQSPVAALQAKAGIVGGLGYTAGGSTSNSTSTQSPTGGGLFAGLGQIGSLASGASQLGALFSDKRLKDNIEHIGQENGHNIYKYTYKGSDKPFIGVMAHEVRETNPEAVLDIDGFMAVDYELIGVNFREAA